MSSFNSEAAALSLLGVTITASAGDNGAPGTNCYCNLNSGSTSVSWAVSILSCITSTHIYGLLQFIFDACVLNFLKFT